MSIWSHVQNFMRIRSKVGKIIEMVLTNRLLFQVKFRNRKYGDAALFQIINKFCLRHKVVKSYYHFASVFDYTGCLKKALNLPSLGGCIVTRKCLMMINSIVKKRLEESNSAHCITIVERDLKKNPGHTKHNWQTMIVIIICLLCERIKKHQYTITLKMADQGWSDLRIVFTVILCGTNFCIW